MFELREKIANLERLGPAATGFIAVGAVSIAESWEPGEVFSGGAILTIGTLAVLRAFFSDYENGEGEE